MTEIERMQAFSYLDGAAAGLKEARNDVIEELENIKAEVKTIKDMEVVNAGVYVREFDVVEIIDRHISELKGE